MLNNDIDFNSQLVSLYLVVRAIGAGVAMDTQDGCTDTYTTQALVLTPVQSVSSIWLHGLLSFYSAVIYVNDTENYVIEKLTLMLTLGC